MENLYLPQDWQIADKKELISDHFLYVLVPPPGVVFPRFTPGQFFEVSVPGLGEAPFSVSSSPTRPGTLEICVRKVGRVSGAMARMRPGDILGIRGPLGNGYPLERIRGRDVLLLAGGLGMVPLRSLMRYVADRSLDHGRLTVLYGAGDDNGFLFFQESNRSSRPSWSLPQEIFLNF